MLSLAEFVKDLTPEQEEAAAKVLEEYELELLHRGYSQDDIEKLWGGNLLRVWREVEAVAAESGQH